MEMESSTSVCGPLKYPQSLCFSMSIRSPSVSALTKELGPVCEEGDPYKETLEEACFALVHCDNP